MASGSHLQIALLTLGAATTRHKSNRNRRIGSDDDSQLRSERKGTLEDQIVRCKNVCNRDREFEMGKRQPWTEMSSAAEGRLNPEQLPAIS